MNFGQSRGDPEMGQKNSRNWGHLIDLDLLLPKKFSPPPRNVAGLWLWAKPKNCCYYPPPHWICPGYGDPEKLLLLPPPTESARLTAIPENFCYYPPPPNLVGLRRSRKIGPPQKKILATPLVRGQRQLFSHARRQCIFSRFLLLLVSQENLSGHQFHRLPQNDPHACASTYTHTAVVQVSAIRWRPTVMARSAGIHIQ